MELGYPRGCGVYVSGIKQAVHGTPQEFASIAKSAGLRHVPILACWQDDRTGLTFRSNASLLADYAQALHEVGVAPAVWGYPKAGHEAKWLATMLLAIETLRARGCPPRYVLPDPEVSYVEQPLEVARLMRGTLDILREGISMGVTTYGVRRYHPRYPWHAINHGFGSPQFYTVAPHLARAAIDAWVDGGFAYQLPSVPTFGPNDDDMLPRYLDGLDDHPAVRGFLFWEWKHTSPGEWRTIERWARLFADREVA